ncbi:hypothetical protein TRVA0_030S01794 [Trichomonascus vanleenenianus]|uniref:uncharacterized protein n=1 Tax=Trichomonascus vanleenenianus TaxID=2268995 RepID=UPI003EC98A70
MMALPPHVSPSFPPSTMSPHLGPQMSPMGRAMGPHPVVGMAPGSAPLYPHHPAQEVHSIEHLPPLANHHHHRGGGFYAHPRGLPAAQPMVPSTPSSVFSISPNTAAGPPPLQPHAPHAAHGAANSLPHGPISMLRRSPPHVPASGSNSPLLNGTRHGSNSPALPPLVGLGSNHERPKSGPASSMLTPQSRPHSPVSRHAASVPLPAPTATQVRVSARGEALTEQLRPRSPDHLDTIPPLRQIYRGGERPKSRVSELEIVNDLLKSRIIQLERSEAAARHSEACVREHELMLRKQIDELKRELDGKSRLVHDLQKRLNDSTTNDDSKRKHIDEQVSRPPQLKRIKVSDML